jgi:hypothetical protein
MSHQAFIYLNTLFRLNLHIESTTHLRELLSTIGFQQIVHLSNVYIRINQGTIFEHILIHQDDSIVHFYAK